MNATASPTASAHTPRVAGVAAIAVILAFLAQTAALPALGLSSAVPVVFATVAVLSTALGSRAGAIVGFLAGLLLDLTGVGVLGTGALTGCLLGAAMGRVRVDRWAWSGLLPVWLGTAAAAMVLTIANALALGLTLTWSWSWLWILLGGLVCVGVLLPLRPWLGDVVR